MALFFCLWRPVKCGTEIHSSAWPGVPCMLSVSGERDWNVHIFYAEFTICTSAWWINIAEPTGRASWERQTPPPPQVCPWTRILSTLYPDPLGTGRTRNGYTIRGFPQNNSWMFLLPNQNQKHWSLPCPRRSKKRFESMSNGKKHDFKQVALTERFLTPWEFIYLVVWILSFK